MCRLLGGLLSLMSLSGPFNLASGAFSWRRDRLPTPVFLGFSCGSAGKESACNAGDLGSIPGLRRSCGEGNGYPLQYSGLENSMDYIVHGVTKTEQLSGAFMAVLPLISNCLILLIGTQRRSWRLGSYLQVMGDKKASMPESATGPFSASFSAYILLVKISNMVKPDVRHKEV